METPLPIWPAVVSVSLALPVWIGGLGEYLGHQAGSSWWLVALYLWLLMKIAVPIFAPLSLFFAVGAFCIAFKRAGTRAVAMRWGMMINVLLTLTVVGEVISLP